MSQTGLTIFAISLTHYYFQECGGIFIFIYYQLHHTNHLQIISMVDGILVKQMAGVTSNGVSTIQYKFPIQTQNRVTYS